jgi:hypothetical protein
MPRAVVQEVSEETFYSKMISIENIKENVVRYGRMFVELCGIYFVWIVLHYVSSHLYVTWCTPLTAVGFVLSPFVVPAPHCQAFRWVIVNGSNSITAMWFTLGTWIAKKIVL